VLEDGPDVCDSESDSGNSDHGEMWSNADMYRPRRETADRRAAAKSAASQPKVSTSCNPSQISTRLLTPLNSDDEDEEKTEDQKKRLASARRKSGREGGLVTVRGPG
jgi:hypothetical protein